MSEIIILAGDIGATNITYSLFKSTQDDNELLKTENFQSKYYKHNHPLDIHSSSENKNIVSSIHEFLIDQPTPTIAVLCIAGVVSDNKLIASCSYGSYLTGTLISDTLNIPEVHLLNDVEGAGYGVFTLAPDEYHEINNGSKNGDGPIVCISIGTGIGQCYITKNRSTYTVHSTEGGFQDMSPKCEEDFELYLHYKRENKSFQMAYSKFISGNKVANIYKWLREKHPELKNEEFDLEFENNQQERAKLLFENGYNGSDELSKRTIEVWERIVGYNLGNLFVNFMPSGGIYIIGGLPSKNYSNLLNPRSLISGYYKGVSQILHESMSRIPIYIVRIDRLGVRGALFYARQLKFS